MAYFLTNIFKTGFLCVSCVLSLLLFAWLIVFQRDTEGMELGEWEVGRIWEDLGERKEELWEGKS